ncbi:hypothetical protein HK405_001408 [Cladochytrium tenue]|nr:hypothetical protein HK405_001408 [Cladochytrium tenue]
MPTASRTIAAGVTCVVLLLAALHVLSLSLLLLPPSSHPTPALNNPLHQPPPVPPTPAPSPSPQRQLGDTEAQTPLSLDGFDQLESSA